MTKQLGRWRGSDAVGARAVRIDNGFLVQAPQAPTPPQRPRRDIHVHLPAGWGRTHDAAAGASGERGATGGLPVVRKDQEVEPSSAGFDQEGENCQVQHGDQFRAHVQDGALLLQHLPNDGNGTGDEDIEHAKLFGEEHPPGSTGDRRTPLLRRMGRDRLADLSMNGRVSDDVAGLAELQHRLNQHYARR